jgi:hypothetical protein
MTNLRLWIALLFLALATTVSGIQRPGEPPYTDAEFTFSTDPTKAILHLKIHSYSGDRWEMTLFGDGKLVILEDKARKDAVHHVRSFSYDETRQVMRRIVDSGLAEWDPLAFEAQFSEKYNTRVPRVIDNPGASITIALETYERGDWQLRDVYRKIRTPGGEEDFVKIFPDIPEYQGMVFIKELLRTELWRAKSKVQQ